ncbi:MAG TPA: hypothetical protein VGM30_04830 [Puia sp.]|jgi:hypothetical protein
MEPWSDLPVINDFKIKIYLDTNILSFILDGIYSGVTTSIQILGQSEFVDLVSSRYVIFELAGIRKKEHFLREVLKTQTGNGTTNLSSLLKYKDDYSSSSVEFSAIKGLIKQKVEQEIETIVNTHYIDYKANFLHDGLLEPTVEICLSSKISKEDSLVMISALLPEKQKPEGNVCMLTKDQQFTTAFAEHDLEPILQNFSLTAPNIEHIKGISLLDGTNVNLTNQADDARLSTFWINKIKEMILGKNTHLYLGKTFTPNSLNLPPNCICFKLKENTNLPNNINLTFISKSLDFIYTIKLVVKEFWNNSAIHNYPFISTQLTNISFLGLDFDNANNPTPISANIVSRLREQDHLVFIHPDSYTN